MKLSVLIIIALFLWVPAIAQIEAASSDDIAVYEAILKHTIRPESTRSFYGSKPDTLPDVILIDRTISTCPNVTHHSMGCLSERVIQYFGSNSDNPNLSSYNPHLPLINENNLIELLFEENAKSCSLPDIGIDGAIVTSQDRLEETVQEYSG
ncbi:hypothetical protein HN388_06405, partial [bacterium]|nr:hypothetical protein [bacterium]